MLKKIVSIILIVCMVSVFAGCGNDMVMKNDRGQITQRYEQIGIFELSEMNSNIEYQVVWGNVVWSILLCQTIVVPVVLIGWYLYEPIGVKANQ